MNEDITASFGRTNQKSKGNIHVETLPTCAVGQVSLQAQALGALHSEVALVSLQKFSNLVCKNDPHLLDIVEVS